MAIEYFPGESFLHRLDARSKAALFIAICYITLVISDPILLCLLSLGVLVLTWACKIPCSRIYNLFKALWPMFILYFITNVWLGAPSVEAAKNPANIMFYLIPPLKFIPVTMQGVLYSIGMIFRFTVIISILRLVTLVTPIRDLVVAAVKCKIPSKVALTVSIAFAFIPVIVQSMNTITEAIKTRGWRGLEKGNPVSKLKALIPVFFPLIMLTVDRAQHMAVAIEARAFSHKISKRTYLREITLSKIDYVTIAFLFALAVLCFIANLMGYGTWEMTMSLIKGVTLP